MVAGPLGAKRLTAQGERDGEVSRPLTCQESSHGEVTGETEGSKEDEIAVEGTMTNQRVNESSVI